MILNDFQRRCLERVAREKGEAAACRNCGSRRVGIREWETTWTSGGDLRVALACPDCAVRAGDFLIPPEEAQNCGLYPPNANLANTPETGF